jgi:hypothetical protein
VSNATHPVAFVVGLQCGRCGDAMYPDEPGQRMRSNMTHWPASCSRCQVTVSVPITWAVCPIIPQHEENPRGTQTDNRINGGRGN